MAALNKHQEKTEATRRNLLKAAQDIFVRDGFAAARIEDITAKAGYTRGAFYANFRTKEDLFLALLEERTQGHALELRALLQRGQSEQERLQLLRDYYVGRLSNKQWTLLILEWKLFALRHPELRAKLAGAHRRIRRSLHMEVLRDLLPSYPNLKEKHKGIHSVVLEVLLGGLVLERAYDPTRISQTQTASVLQTIFDMMMETQRGSLPKELDCT